MVRQFDWRTFLRNRSGNISIMTAAAASCIIGVLALGVDYGSLTLQRRALQSTSDLAAIVAASSIEDPERALLDYLALNGKTTAIKRDRKLITTRGEFPFDDLKSLPDVEGYMVVTRGRYAADPALAPADRFVPGASPPNAVRLTTTELGDLIFARSMMARPDISVGSMAAVTEQAAFSVGTQLAGLNGGILNKVLGRLLGTSLTLSAMDYQALAAADLEIGAFTESLATRLRLTGATYDELLKTDMKLNDFVNALGGTRGLSAPAAAILNGIGKTLGSTQADLRLDQLLNLDVIRPLVIGQARGLAAKVSALELLNAAAALANAGKQVSVDLGASVPGLSDVTLDLAIGEPPVGTPFLAVGQAGSIVRTAQTRVRLTASVSGLSALAGLKLTVPLYIEVAHAEAALTELACTGQGPSDASVKIKAVPGVAEIALGNVDTAALVNFVSQARVKPATILDSLLVQITAMGHVDSGNLAPTTLTFSAQDIAAARVRTVSTKDTLTSLTTSLLGSLDLNIRLLVITIGTPKAVQQALSDTLATLTVPLDTLLYNTLLTLGIRIGAADVRVTGTSCENPVLVQ